MTADDDKQGATGAPGDPDVPSTEKPSRDDTGADQPGADQSGASAPQDDVPAEAPGQPGSAEPREPDLTDDEFAFETGEVDEAGEPVILPPAVRENQPASPPATVPRRPSTPRKPPTSPPPPPDDGDDGDDEEEGMLRMSFMEHLEEFRSRLIKMLIGLAVAFGFSLFFANQLWDIVRQPAVSALEQIGASPNLAQIEPMDVFVTIWVKLPMLVAIFLASPWILYQLWAFIAPGLYKRERRLVVPVVSISALLFILGGLFAYFVAFRFGLAFLLGIGIGNGITPVINVTKYFDLFVNVTLGIGLVFELPVLIFFLVLLRVVTPGFLLRHSRYAVLIIVIAAAIITPTPDVVNLMLFSVPMVLLYFFGVFAGFLLNVRRDKQKVPWLRLVVILLGILLLIALAAYAAIGYFGFQFQTVWPFITR